MVQGKNREKKRLVKFDISQYQYLYPTDERMFHIIKEDSPSPSPQLLGQARPGVTQFSLAWVVFSLYPARAYSERRRRVKVISIIV